MNSISPIILASSGSHDYLYGLFFLIVALLIGAATRHFLKRIPLPFTVLLLLIGLGMGGLNRAYGPHGGQAQHGDTIVQSEGLLHKFVDTLSGAITWGGNLDGHLILYVFLPILIFEAGFSSDLENRLIVEQKCHKCGYDFLSSIDYNKHIIECNKKNGDL